MSKFNDLIEPYSKEGHNHRLQPIKAKLNHFVPCYKEVDGSFVQILEIYKFHWVVAANFNLCVTDNNDKTTVHTVYIFDACLNTSFRKKVDEVKYPISFIQDISHIVSRPKNEIKFVLLNVPQASKREYAGFYAVAFTYIILKGRIVSRCAINQALLPDHLMNFLEYSIYSENIFIYRKVISPLYAPRHWGTNEKSVTVAKTGFISTAKILNGFQTLTAIYPSGIAHLVIRFLSCILIHSHIWFLTSYLWNYVLLMRKCT